MTELAARYELIRPLGSGGMGVVHEAFDRHLGRRVAIKMIRGASIDALARERFLREARAAAAVSHPNVCLLHEVGEHGGQPFLVMELLEGEPLSDRLRGGPLAASAGAVRDDARRFQETRTFKAARDRIATPRADWLSAIEQCHALPQ